MSKDPKFIRKQQQIEEKKMDAKEVGSRLKEVRLFLRLSLEEVADVLCVTSGQVSKIEQGVHNLSMDKAIALYKAYSIDPTYLYTGIAAADHEEFDYYLINCSANDRIRMLDRLNEYLKQHLQ